MVTYRSKGTAETEQLAADFAALLRPGDIVAYQGGLGVGKTAFTRGLAAGLSLCCEVSSPTFALVHEYRGQPLSLFHFDMYRIDSIADLDATGYFDYLEENQIMAVEWSENVADILDQNTIYVTLSTLSEEERLITIEGGGGRF